MTAADFEQAVLHAAQLITASRSIVAVTGAGISTPSGIPDFRSASTGLWEKDDPMEVASLSAFQHRPQVFFDWLRPLAAQIMVAQPNFAHRALAELESLGHLKVVITQNIDGLHQKAGSQHVIEVHGSAATLTCQSCKFHTQLDEVRASFFAAAQIPHCPRCGANLKPDIVLYEELLPVKAWSESEQYCWEADLILVIGSSLEVQPVASLPLFGLERGAKLIINTYSHTYLDRRAALVLPYDVSEVLPAIVEQVKRL